MEIEWIKCLAGGGLIGVALSMFVLINKKNVGISDMLKNAIEIHPSKLLNNQLIFLVGVLVSPLVFSMIIYPIDEVQLNTQPLIIIISGLLVGAGARLSNGGFIKIVVTGFRRSYKKSGMLLLILLTAGLITQFFINTVLGDFI